MVENTLPGLFDGVPEAKTPTLTDVKKRDAKEEGHALDEMLRSSRLYRHSSEYIKLLDFIAQFRSYAPFNCMLVYIQNPDVTYFASVRDWSDRFGRRPMESARPMVILQPFGPVMFLYDVSETEADPYFKENRDGIPPF